MSASILDNRFIYLFGGEQHGSPLDTIEQYDISERQTWVVLYSKLYKSLGELSSITISPTEILLFGGYSGGDQLNSYIFNGETNTIIEKIEMPRAPGQLIPSAPVIVGDTVYAQQRITPIKLFSFNLITKQWDECDGMDIGQKGSNLPNYIEAKYMSTLAWQKKKGGKMKKFFGGIGKKNQNK